MSARYGTVLTKIIQGLNITAWCAEGRNIVCALHDVNSNNLYTGRSEAAAARIQITPRGGEIRALACSSCIQ